MLATLSFAFPALAKDAVLKSAKTMPELIKASSPADWRALNPENTLYLELEKGRVVIELAPDFAPQHAANIKALIREGYFDGLAIVRSQENYVVQWADPDEKRELKTAKKIWSRNLQCLIPHNCHSPVCRMQMVMRRRWGMRMALPQAEILRRAKRGWHIVMPALVSHAE
jgi:hypothetical protein